MSEVEQEPEVVMTAGHRLRAAREARGFSLDDVATTTRIPTRHLTSLETGDFTKLPAPTYSIGFAKSYAGAVGLDRNEIGEQLRAELGGARLAPHQSEQFEPMDPARAMPRWLIFVAIAAIVAVALAASWLNSRSLNAPDNVVAEESAALDTAPSAAPPPITNASGPVVITADQQAWIQVRDGTTLLKEGVLEPGQSFAVPPTATAPVLTTAKAEVLRISVGTATAPQVGPASTRVSNVSLLGPALLRGPAAPAPATAAPAPAPAAAPTRPAPRPVQRRAAPPPATVPAANTVEPAALTNTQ